MSSLEIVGLICIILISAFAIVGIIIAVPLFKLINRIKFLSENLNENLIPVVSKLDSTVSHLNTEISSIGDLTQSIGSIVEQLEKIIRLARIIVTNPVIKLISAGIGVAEGIKKTSQTSSKSQSDQKKSDFENN